MQVIEKKILAFKQIHSALKNVVVDDKCRSCKCFHDDVLTKIHDALKRFNEKEPEHKLLDIEADFSRWAKDVDPFEAHG